MPLCPAAKGGKALINGEEPGKLGKGVDKHWEDTEVLAICLVELS